MQGTVLGVVNIEGIALTHDRGRGTKEGTVLAFPWGLLPGP